jgi:hypothetical protein
MELLWYLKHVSNIILQIRYMWCYSGSSLDMSKTSQVILHELLLNWF